MTRNEIITERYENDIKLDPKNVPERYENDKVGPQKCAN